MEDNNVYVNIKINTDGVKLGTKEVSNAITRAAQDMAKYGKAAQTSCDSAANAFMRQNQAVANAAAEVDKLSAKLAEAQSKKVKTSFLTDEEDALKTLENEYSKLEDKKLQMESSGKQNTQKYAETLELMRDINREIEIQKNLLLQLENDPRSYTTADTSAIEEKLAAAKQKLAATTNSASLAYEKFNNTLEKNKSKLAETENITKETAKSLKKIDLSSINLNKSFKKGLTTILKYGFGIRSLYLAFRKLRQAMIEGFQTLAKENPQFNKAISGVVTQLQTLKNSFAAAFAPLVTAVAPIIEAFLAKLNALMQGLSKLIAMLTGSNTFLTAKKQQVDYAKSLDKTGSAAKKAKKYLSGLDEIATFTPKDDTSGGGGAGNAFEDMALEDKDLEKFKKLKNLLDKLKSIFDKLKGIFKDGFLAGLGDKWKEKISNILSYLERIKKAIKDIITDERVVKAVTEMIEKIVYALGQMCGAIVSIILSIVEALTGGIAKFLEDHSEEIKQFIITVANLIGNIWELLGNFAQTIAYILEVLGGENGIRVVAAALSIVWEILSNIVEIALKVVEAVLTFFIKPIIDNADKLRQALDNTLGFLADILETIAEFAKDLGEEIQKLWDEHIKPFLDDVTDDVSELVGIIVDFYNNEIKPVLDKIGREFKEMYDSDIKPTMDRFFEILGEGIDLFKQIWDVISPYIKQFIKEMLPALKKEVENTWNVLKSIIKLLLDQINVLFDIVSGHIKVFVQLLNGDFSGAWQTVKETVRTVCQDIMNVVQDMFNVVSNLFGRLFDRYINNNVFSKISDAISNVTSGRTISLGGHNGMPSNVPHLATGAVIPPNAPFLATLGDQRNGNNFEAPEGLLRQVVREESGSGQYQFTAQINRRVLFDEFISEAKLRQSASGRNPLLSF